jgi:hypothetical protein
MLEIIGIIVFCKHLAGVATGKGRSKGWAALGVLFWVLGEIIGGVIGFAVAGDGFAPYIFALMGAAVGAAIAWVIVSNLSAMQDSMEGMADEHTYSHADAGNPYSPPGFGRRD